MSDNERPSDSRSPDTNPAEQTREDQQRAWWQAAVAGVGGDENLAVAVVTKHYQNDLAHLTPEAALEAIPKLAARYPTHGGDAVVMQADGLNHGDVIARSALGDTETLGGVIRARKEARRQASRLRLDVAPREEFEPTSLGDVIRRRNAARRQGGVA